MKKFIGILKKNKPVLVGFTPAFQSYYSSGDEAEPYCLVCDEMLEDDMNYCPPLWSAVDVGRLSFYVVSSQIKN